MPADYKLRLVESHRPTWFGFWMWVGFIAVFFGGQGVLAWCLVTGHWWAVPLLVLALGHVMHAHLIAFHEAAHGSLAPDRLANDAAGRFIGLFSLMSLSLYRAVHHYHHTYLASERDEELWPFAIPGSSIWLRRTVAACELLLGLFYTPFLFLRSFLRAGSPVTKPATRRAVWFDLVYTAIVWAVVLSVCAWLDLWKFLVVMYLLPALLAGSFQSLRKYVEHMGLAGSTPLSSTRSILPTTGLGRFLSFSLFNEPYHGVHHRYAHVPQHAMPEFADLLEPTNPDEPPPYSSYRAAFRDMVQSLWDPRVGAQWNGAARTGPRSEPSEMTTEHEPALSRA